MKTSSLFVVAASIALTVAATALGHGGRRLEIGILDGQLFAQGYISTGGDDMGGNPRPYLNVIHGHWDNIAGPVVAAVADLPGFDVYNSANSYINANGYSGGGVAELLEGEDLSLTLVGAYKWSNPPAMGPFGTAVLDPLSMGEVITITHGLQTIDTDTLGTFLLAENIAATGAPDLDLTYSIADEPSGVLYALEWTLSTTAPGVADSGSIFTILSADPDPTNSGTPNPMVGLHHQALHLERQLSTAVPEAGSITLVGLGAGAVALLTYLRRRAA